MINHWFGGYTPQTWTIWMSRWSLSKYSPSPSKDYWLPSKFIINLSNPHQQKNYVGVCVCVFNAHFRNRFIGGIYHLWGLFFRPMYRDIPTKYGLKNGRVPPYLPLMCVWKRMDMGISPAYHVWIWQSDPQMFRMFQRTSLHNCGKSPFLLGNKFTKHGNLQQLCLVITREYTSFRIIDLLILIYCGSCL